MDYEFEYSLGYPVLVNDPGQTGRLVRIAACLGSERVITLPKPVMGSEDFAYYLEKVPGVFAFLGAGNPAKGMGLPHQPRYNFDEEALPLGAAILGTALDILAVRPWQLMLLRGRQESARRFPNHKPYVPLLG